MEDYCDIRLSKSEINTLLDILETVTTNHSTRDIKTELKRAKIKEGWK